MPAEHLRGFAPLIGSWRTEAHTSRHWEGRIDAGTSTFEWILDEQFLLWRSEVESPIPSGVWVIGAREDAAHPGSGSGDTLAHYFDSRGVFRVFRTSFEDGVWRLWRDEPGFDQRAEYRVVDDGSRVEGTFFMRNDGDWFVDFHVDYIRI